MSALNYQLETQKILSSSVSAKLDSNDFKKPSKSFSIYPFPEYFNEVLRAEWAVPGNGNSIKHH